MAEITIKSKEDFFLVNNPDTQDLCRQIPKHNQRFIELKPEITDERTIELSVSSDTPYFRWFGYEELDHSTEAVDLSRFNDGANVLFNHNRDDYIAVIQKAWLDGGKLYNKILFDTHELAEKIYQSIKAGIVRNVSIGYEINELKLIGQRDNIDVYRAVRWTPFESSIVTVPADHSVGINRSYFIPVSGENLESNVTKDKDMGDDKTPALEINEQDIRQQERDRVRGINALIQKYGHPELGENAIMAGMSIENARSKYLDAVTVESKQDPVAVGVKPVGMSDPERRQYSFNRAVGYAAGLISADKCGLELEVSRELENRIGKPPKGKLYLDQSQLVSYRAPYETGVPAAAGNLIDTELLSDRFIDQLYNMSAFLPMGVTYLRDLQGNIEIPRESTYQNAYWIGRNCP